MKQRLSGGGETRPLAQYLPTGFETLHQARDRRQLIVGRLKKSSAPGTSELANLLANCRKAERCGSSACPVCTRLYRKRLIRAADDALSRDEPMTRVSWVPQRSTILLGDLAAFNLRCFIASRQRALQRALPDVVCFGGIDLSLNVTLGAAPYWVVHAYMLLESADTPDLRAQLRAHCVGDPASPRPFSLKQVKAGGRSKVVSYTAKAQFYRRSSYTDSTGRANTRAQSLPADAAVEAALFQHRWPLHQRLILRRLRLVHRRDGLRLVRRNGDRSR